MPLKITIEHPLAFIYNYKIIWIVRAFWLVNKCSFTLWSTKMAWAIWFAISKMWEFTVSWKKLKNTYSSYIVFLFVKTENNNFIKEIKTCSPCLHSLVKTSAKFVRIFEQVKPSTAFRGFTELLRSNSPKRSPRFSPGFEDTESMFYFLK